MGMAASGKIIPDRRICGSSVMIASWIAWPWFCETVEIRIAEARGDEQEQHRAERERSHRPVERHAEDDQAHRDHDDQVDAAPP